MSSTAALLTHAQALGINICLLDGQVQVTLPWPIDQAPDNARHLLADLREYRNDIHAMLEYGTGADYPKTEPWDTVLTNVRELYPWLIHDFRAIQRLGIAINAQGHRHRFEPGTFSESGLAHVTSTLYFRMVDWLVEEPLQGLLRWLRHRGARIIEVGDAGLRILPGSIDPAEWETIRREQLEPHREEIAGVAMQAREQVSLVMAISGLAKVTDEKVASRESL